MTNYEKRRKEGRCVNCPNTSEDNALCVACREKRKQKYAAYGGKCACCGEETPEFLQVDHVNNDGAAHRKSLGGNNAGCQFCTRPRVNGSPKDDFQLLCANCNYAKARYGKCPHQIDDHENIEDHDTEPWEGLIDDEHTDEILDRIDYP